MGHTPTSNRFLRALELPQRPIDVIGAHDPLMAAWMIGQARPTDRPCLIVTSTAVTARQLQTNFRSLFNIDSQILEGFDESPYSGLSMSKAYLNQRLRFLGKAIQAQSRDIFIATFDSLMQRTTDPAIFKPRCLEIKKGEEILIEDLLELLAETGYMSVPVVEDVGTFSKRGDILDIFAPTYDDPIRIEFFGDQVEGIKFFDISTQRSLDPLESVFISPAREIILTDHCLEFGVRAIREQLDSREVTKSGRENFLAPLTQRIPPEGLEFWTGYFNETAFSFLDFFPSTPLVFWLDELEVRKSADIFIEEMAELYKKQNQVDQPTPDPKKVWLPFEEIKTKLQHLAVNIKPLEILNEAQENSIDFKFFDISQLATETTAAREARRDYVTVAVEKLTAWRNLDYTCVIFSGTQTQAERTKFLLESHGLQGTLVPPPTPAWPDIFLEQSKNKKLIHLTTTSISSGGRLEEDQIIFIRDEDIFGQKSHREKKAHKASQNNVTTINFGDFASGDHIVHVQHGIGIYEGLKKLPIHGVENEYLSLRYRDNDKLYLPIYRISQIQKYSGPEGSVIIDKLGGTAWHKAKVKVRNSLRDMAHDLLDLYAKRMAAPGFCFAPPDDEFREFEGTFPYDETPDQAKAIEDVLEDMQKNRPMDRLVCGDVGFGKTEVAIRAAFKAVQDNKQVALLVPTTVLAFQHARTFTQRFKDTGVRVALLSRFSSAAQQKKDIAALETGGIDIVIGTHRLLSKDIVFKDLGLLIIDEEQRFGVAQKEKIKKYKSNVDVLTLSATPIPRTLNMSLMGARDLSLITTPPEERLSIRTFISRFDPKVIEKAILTETQRGGQVYFIHNKVQSILSFAEDIKSILPGVRLAVAHGQMPNDELEKVMVSFFNHEYDVLLCTTIIENGLDIPSANTIIVDRADTFGLSQLYQLRGRVGRSKNRSYAYLLIPPQGVVDKLAQERLRVLQENSELGSGIRIAHHDLELRGGGNILGEDQSGHIAAVGYELYMDLLNQALSEAKGVTVEEEIEPDINLPFQALIPDSYIEDIRIRLSYYRTLGAVKDERDLVDIENDMLDRFGPIPEPVANLFGIMLIRSLCKALAIKDISQGPANLSLSFSSSTKVKPEAIVRLTTTNDRYQLTPDQRLIIKMKSKSWMVILEELKHLSRTLLEN